MIKKIVGWLYDNAFLICVFVFFGVISYVSSMPPKPNAVLKEYKDGVQNHLIWNLKGECFFVRPNDDITVYLVRVQDCDKK